MYDKLVAKVKVTDKVNQLKKKLTAAQKLKKLRIKILIMKNTVLLLNLIN